jgi:hypothetical protein
MASGDQGASLPIDSPLDVNVLKEIAKKDLVDALNSVCLDSLQGHQSPHCSLKSGQWGQNSCFGCVSRRTTGSRNGGFFAEGNPPLNSVGTNN